MTENGDPLENPVAKRINGILKNEYLREYKDMMQLQLEKSIMKYNKPRPHLSCNMLTPEQAHRSVGKLKERWRNYYEKQVYLEL